MEYNILQAKETHVDEIYNIQIAVYEPCLWESKATIQNVINANSSIVVVQGSKIVAYVLAHFIQHDPPLLDTLIDCNTTSTFFIHDMCVHTSHQRHGIGQLMFMYILNMLNNTVKVVKLVALQNSITYWKKWKFKECDTSDDIRECYGDHAKVMQLLLQT